MSIYAAIDALISYGVQKQLIEKEDKIYIRNQLLAIMNFPEYKEEKSDREEAELSGQEFGLADILKKLTDEALISGLISEDTVLHRDLFDTKLMGILTDRPSQVIWKFWKYYQEDPKRATEYLYQFCQDVNYIRRDRICRDKKWQVNSPYGVIDITINRSRPENDPKAIMAAKKLKQSNYPKCQLCVENEGYAGRLNHPARQNHRIIPVILQGEEWGFQYSPYVYYNEHCIVLNGRHIPMKIERKTFECLFDFVKMFPHYFLGSNADLPIVGGSILTHDHFQGGHYTFAVEKAAIEKYFIIPEYEDVEVGIVHWPLSILRLRGKDEQRLIALADHILESWKTYTDEAAFIYAETDGEPHNTITPIARKKGEIFELDLTLRNNITTEEYPLGVYHSHQENHHIKKENIGLIEVMGLAVLPARLDREMKLLAEYLTAGMNPEENDLLEKHAKWAEEVNKNHPDLSEKNVMEILQAEIGKVFIDVLENSGVYKCTEQGREAFERFIKTL